MPFWLSLFELLPFSSDPDALLFELDELLSEDDLSLFLSLSLSLVALSLSLSFLSNLSYFDQKLCYHHFTIIMVI